MEISPKSRSKLRKSQVPCHSTSIATEMLNIEDTVVKNRVSPSLLSPHRTLFCVLLSFLFAWAGPIDVQKAQQLKATLPLLFSRITVCSWLALFAPRSSDC